MRKLPRKFENPIDWILIDICEKVCPLFKQFDLTPNHITTLSLLFGLVSLILFQRKSFKLSAVLLFISYAFDCLDGHYARKYKMETKFGDYYDHVKDILLHIGFLTLLLLQPQISPKRKALHFSLWILCFLGMAYHLSCQEQYIIRNRPDIESSESLQILRPKILPCPPENMTISRYMGSGTFNLVLSLIIISHQM